MRGFAIAFAAIVGCAQPERIEHHAIAAVPGDAAAIIADATPSCIADAEPFDEAVLRARLGFLGGKDLDGRAPGSDGDAAAIAMIVERFRCLGLSAPTGAFEQPFTTGSGAATANVIGVVKGSDPVVGSDVILVASHHDHLGSGFPGANDNASGVVAMLAIAQAIQQRKTPPRRTIVFAAFGDEEDGMIGSEFYAAHVPTDHVVQIVNLDMVGSYASEGFVAAMGTFPKLAGRTLLDELDPKFPSIHIGLGGISRGSDFEPFCKLGIPYVFFWTPDARCYHKKCDTVDRIDFPRMTTITTLAGALTDRLADTDLDLAVLRKELGCFAKRHGAS